MNKPLRKIRPTVRDGQLALRDHVVTIAAAARARYGPVIDRLVLQRLLADRELIRYPVTLRFGTDALLDGEMAFPEPCGDHPRSGFTMWVHPLFRCRDDALALVVAYQLVRVNYADLASHEEAEWFGATLLGMEREAYYNALCALADELTPDDRLG
jgi:hypothetical protein